MIKTIFFDLDGTLLPMNNDKFIEAYFGRLAAKLAPHGYEPNKLIEAVWSGTKTMMVNDGSRTNEEAFWGRFVEIYGKEALDKMNLFDEFYHNEFQEVQKVCGFNEKAKKVVERAKELGCRVILATNPLFPAIATESRIRWAGLTPEDFEVYTTYETCRYCKPNPKYYQELAERVGVNPAECLMVGNDVYEDMVASGKIGMKGFLLTDCLIDDRHIGIADYPNGGFDELLAYLDKQFEKENG